MPSFVQFDVNQVNPESGFQALEQGWYILEVQDAREVKTERNGEHTRRNYKSKVLMGPGNTQDAVGRRFVDGIREDAQWNGRHMELYCACFYGVAQVRQFAAQNGGRFDVEALHGKQYIAYITKSDDGRFNNVNRRVPYTQNNWNAVLSDQDPTEYMDGIGAPGAQQAAPQPGAPQPGAAPTAPPPTAAAPPPTAAPQPPPAAPPQPTAGAPAPTGAAPVPPGPPLPPTNTPGS
jgi:hypothetical protein